MFAGCESGQSYGSWWFHLLRFAEKDKFQGRPGQSQDTVVIQERNDFNIWFFFSSPVNAAWFLVCWLLKSCIQRSKVNNTNIILRHAIPPKCCQDQREHLFFVFLRTFLWCIFAHDKQTRLDFFFPSSPLAFLWPCAVALLLMLRCIWKDFHLIQAKPNTGVIVNQWKQQ